MAAISRPRLDRCRRRSRIARQMVANRERGLEDGDPGRRMVLSLYYMLGRSDFRHYGGQQRGCGEAEKGFVFRRRSRKAPTDEHAGWCTRWISPAGKSCGARGASRAFREGSKHLEEQFPRRDSGDRRRTCVRLFSRQCRACSATIFRASCCVVQRGEADGHALWLGHSGVARAGSREAVPGA